MRHCGPASVLPRRRVFQLVGVVGASVVVAACSTDTKNQKTARGTTRSTPTSTTATPTPAACAKTTLAETAGMYAGGADKNYLRCVQVAGQDGRVSFISIFPACEADRWPHINIEIFDWPGSAVAAANARLTTQIALPECPAMAPTPS